MSKRRRNSSVASRPDDDDDASSEASPISIRKKKRLDPSEMCQVLYDSIRNQKKEDGSMLCDTFIRVPKRRQEPSYYDVVINPIDLLRVQQKLKTDSYEDVEELALDVELLVNNAKAFYKSDSTEYADACQLWESFIQNKQKLLDAAAQQDEAAVAAAVENKRPVRVGRKPRTSAADTDDASEGSKEDDIDTYEELFASVMTATDPADNRPLYAEFQLLPSKRLYPDYYDVIEHPIDLKLIAAKIQTQAYTCLSEMERDLLQMVKNACAFNEPGSQIYKDAKTLKKIFLNRKVEIESGKYKPSRPKRRGAALSAITAALKEDPETSDEELDDMDTEGDGPMWQLFDQIYNTANSSDDHTTDAGAPLGESLWKLPNRRFHPEYYAVIRKPISMTQIRNKLKKGSYSNITEMTADLYLMIDNAKKAYGATHKIHKDALKMQKVLNQKLIDVGVDQEESDEDDENASVNSSPSTPPVPRKKGRPRIHPIITSPVNTPSSASANVAAQGKGRFPSIANNPVLKKKLLGLTKYLTEYTVAGRRPMALFMEKPSKKQYPDYYDVITHPIDMTTIETQIKSDRYGTLDDIVGDYRLMFSNCRKYNEEGSMIYEDANLLERALNEKLKEFSVLNVGRAPPKTLKTIGRKSVTLLESKLRQLYDAIRDHKDAKSGRQLCTVFMKLPSKNDYPDYYDIIKNPLDMEKVSAKIKQQAYDTLEELAADFMLMFENACKYNEPDSQIYKDALILQQLCIQKKQTLRDGNDESMPDTQLAVQELLMSLFTILYNHQDEEGRCFSDSLAEMPEYDESEGNKIRAISLDLIKRRLDKGLYKRLDIFQEDVFACLDRARRLSRTDSQVFEDSIELQSFFIKKRDELCKNGETLSSPALSYSAMHLSAAVEAVRQSKLLQEEQEHEAEMEMSAINGESMTMDQKVYSPGDFVYYESPDQKVPGVAYIERLWTNQENVKMMYGNIFYRPCETYHVTTRKFMEQELFKSDQHLAMPLSQVRNKCHVMFIKDYIKYKPENFADRDIYVCESRYNSRGRSFKKIKSWPFVRMNDPVQLTLRDVPVEPKRIMSVFKERVEKHKGELAELQLQEALVEKDKPNVLTFVSGGEEGCTYYEQYNTVCSGVIKTGDFVYVATEGGKQSIAQINVIWETQEGKSYFRGPWLLTAPEVPTAITSARSTTYKQEVFLSTVQETSPLIAIVGRCSALEYSDYIHARPTEIPECDVYICEYVFDEMKKQLRKIQPPETGLHKFSHSSLVTGDEIYYYKRNIIPQKVGASTDEIKFETSGSDLLGITEDSMDGGQSSVCSDLISTPVSAVGLFGSSKKQKSNKKQVITGYILYSREMRKTFVKSNKDATFGEISRLVGNEWRSLPGSERQMWEESASKINEEASKRIEEMGCASPLPMSEPLQNQVYECCWDKCDWQFEDVADCLEHAVANGTGHVQNFLANDEGAVFHCLWRGCIRLKKQAPPFPNLVRLVKHVREVHINKCNGRVIEPCDRSKNYLPSKKQIQIIGIPQQQSILSNSPQLPSPLNCGIPQNNASQIPNHTTFQIVTTPQPVEPMFVMIPPRPQRVLHSEAYMKYIEGLQPENRFVSPWEKTLHAQESNTTVTDTAKMPMNWIGYKSQENPDQVVSALWQLRDFMMRDVLQLNQGYLQ